MIDVVPMEKTDESFEFALAVKRDALGPHIVERWGWDDKLQRNQQSGAWATLKFFRIIRDGASIGTVSLEEASDRVTLVGFYILPSFHRKGIGTEVLMKIVSEANAKRLPVRLRCLKWNPALALYKRHGFAVTGETDTHFQMERPPHDS
jgi:RimJ/RimL family protein N-acetyltransferase